jgi:F0F1-type ATP synthase membrane subunit c/vacuolar-type H+-ATPase subunit K
MAKSPKPSASDSNLLLATIVLIGCAFVGSVGVYVLCTYVLSSFQNTNAMVMLITDAGTKSDDPNLQRQLTTATLGLQACRDLGLALALGCFGTGVAVSIRIWKQRTS